MHIINCHDCSQPLVFITIADVCPSCGRQMEHKNSGAREIVTLAGGRISIVEEYFVCTRCKDSKTGNRIIHHSEALRRILPHNSKYGYDIEIEAGYLQYADNMQMDEIRDTFKNNYGISIRQSQIHELGKRFLSHMVVNHYRSAQKLAELFRSGCVYHIDATCEAGRGMELVIKEGWTGIVLGAWKIPTENEEIIKKHLKSVVDKFGEPVAFVSDMGNGMIAAITGVIREMNLRSRLLVCHTHFIKAVGKYIYEKAFNSLKSQLKKQKTLSELNRIIKEMGDIINPQVAVMRDYLKNWQNNNTLIHCCHGEMESVAVLRALAQWVLSYASDCNGECFPFALSHLYLFKRCVVALESLLVLLAKDCFHENATKYANRLQLILEGLVKNPDIQRTVLNLNESRSVFTELRTVMRLEKTDVYKQDKDKKTPDKIEIISKLKEETSLYRITLKERLDTGTFSDAQIDAFYIILSYFDQYESWLFGHHVVLYDDSGNIIVKLIERSNNIMERSFNDQKHQIRRRTGVKNLGYVFEHIFPASAMIVNLENPIYQKIAMDSKSRGELVNLFSSLDDFMEYSDTPMYQDEYEIVGGRLPKSDRKIVGNPEFTKFINTLSGNICKSELSFSI